MAVKTETVTVTTTRTRLAVAGEDGVATVTAGTVYFGGDDVDTSSKGEPVTVDGRVEFELSRWDALYAVVASGTGTVRVFKRGDS